MTHSQSQPIPRNRWEAEQLWNVSLLPVAATTARSAPPQTIVLELPLEKLLNRSAEAQRRNAA